MPPTLPGPLAPAPEANPPTPAQLQAWTELAAILRAGGRLGPAEALDALLGEVSRLRKLVVGAHGRKLGGGTLEEWKALAEEGSLANCDTTDRLLDLRELNRLLAQECVASQVAFEQRPERALGAETPWPLVSVLTTLLAGAEHLSEAHDCDCRGYEDHLAAQEAGKTLLALLGRVPGGPFSPQREALPETFREGPPSLTIPGLPSPFNRPTEAQLSRRREELRASLRGLPLCDLCQAIATRGAKEGEGSACDACHPPWEAVSLSRDFPWAPSVRKLTRLATR